MSTAKGAGINRKAESLTSTAEGIFMKNCENVVAGALWLFYLRVQAHFTRESLLAFLMLIQFVLIHHHTFHDNVKLNHISHKV